MTQSEHPPEPTRDLARRSLLIPLNSPPVHTLSVFGFVHYGQSRKTPPYVSTNVVLGNRYDSTELDVLQQLALPPERRTMAGNFDGYEISPAAREVMWLLGRPTPLERRMYYRAYLEQALEHAVPDSKHEIGLQLERRLWRMFDFAEMAEKLDRGLEWPLKHTLTAPQNEHWFWMLPLVRGHATPTTPSWRGMKHVPVHRLLWPMVYPTQPFKSNPQRESFCNEPMCVSPWHFYDPSTRPAQSYDGPGRGYEAEYSTGTRVRWHIENVVTLPDGTRSVKCPAENCGVLTRDRRVLDLVNDPAGLPEKGGVMYCWNCYQVWRLKTRGGAPIRPRLPDKHRLETKAEREHRQFLEAMEQEERAARGLRFAWDNEWSDGTSTKDMPRKPY